MTRLRNLLIHTRNLNQPGNFSPNTKGKLSHTEHLNKQLGGLNHSGILIKQPGKDAKFQIANKIISDTIAEFVMRQMQIILHYPALLEQRFIMEQEKLMFKQ